MALHIRNQETDRLARELARETGEEISYAIGIAVAERLERLRNHSSELYQDLRRLASHAPNVLDARPLDELLDYGAEGLPE